MTIVKDTKVSEESTKINKGNKVQKTTAESKKKDWININNEYLLPKSFVENCVIYVQRSGSTLILRTIEDYSDITTISPTEQRAVELLNEINSIFEEHLVKCNVDFSNVPETTTANF